MRRFYILLTAILAALGAQAQSSTPDGAIRGFFSTSADRIVYFSRGNLQYKASTKTWRFAENQTDCIGKDNNNISDTYDGWIDLFGWGTGNNPTLTNQQSAYYPSFTDWGTNVIGTSPANTWRTPGTSEWWYITKGRPNADQLYSRGTVDGVHGLILLPDNFPLSTISWRPQANGWDYNKYSAYQWEKMEAKGAVFLPAAGARDGNRVFTYDDGRYWSDVPMPQFNTLCMRFYEYLVDPQQEWSRSYGHSVRLVWTVPQYTITVAQPAHGTLTADTTRAMENGIITLTATPAEGYRFRSISAMQGTNSLPITCVDEAAGTYQFTVLTGDVTVKAAFIPEPSYIAHPISVSADRRVYFSQGNLSYRASTDTWQFADYQIDYLGTANVADGQLADHIDLFGWSGSTGAKWGISTSANDADYSGDFVDWGTNPIANGGNTLNPWRTLTKDEWTYILYDRPNADKLFSTGTVHDAQGILILPDNWQTPDGLTFKSSTETGLLLEADGTCYISQGRLEEYWHNKYTADEWQRMEQAGAVFLPAANSRSGIDASTRGAYYWTGTPDSNKSTEAYSFYYTGQLSSKWPDQRHFGTSVRLAHDVVCYTITPADTEHGTYTIDRQEAEAGEVVNITITSSDNHYQFHSVSITQDGTPVSVTPVEGKSDKYRFTMPAGAVVVSVLFEKMLSAFTPKAFSISADKQVYFSPGNLQCSGVTTGNLLWHFAEYQDYCIGNANLATDADGNLVLADTIDLFGWSNQSETPMWGISTSNSEADYEGDFLDWGTNPIVNGGNTPNMWRTLSIDEWIYILFDRPNADKLFALATVCGTCGLIILPDDWEQSEGIAFRSATECGWEKLSWQYLNRGDYKSAYNINTYTTATWLDIESAGAVFLPAAGIRGKNTKSEKLYINAVQQSGWYRYSSTSNRNMIRFTNSQLYEWGTSAGSIYGASVRLVRDITDNPPTGCDNAAAPQPATVRKELRNGNVVIICNGQEYNLLGERLNP